MNLEELGLIQRAENALRRAGINTVEDLCELEEPLFLIRGIGQVGYNDIRKKLEQKGIEMKKPRTP